MKRPLDERLLAFLEGELSEAERAELLSEVEADPQAARRLRAAAVGLEALRPLRGVEPVGGAQPATRRLSPWWVAAASAAATALIAVPATWAVTAGAPDQPPAASAQGMPEAADPSFVLVLRGVWPDAQSVEADERRRRGAEYWAWTSSLADEGILVAAGDLRWEPGERLGPAGRAVQVSGDEPGAPDYVVGMFAVRAPSYEAALEIARACPHLRYGGSVSVRRVAAGFVTVPGMGDWSE